jgi:hypothetical protein
LLTLLTNKNSKELCPPFQILEKKKPDKTWAKNLALKTKNFPKEIFKRSLVQKIFLQTPKRRN